MIGDDVDVQAGACIDRAAVGKTEIGRGTKIDNLVQIGHGCVIGEDTLLCGQVGLAGSTKVGDRVMLAGQVGTAGHLTIHDDVQVAGRSGVAHDLKAGGVYGGGMAAFDLRDCIASSVQYKKLPQLARRLKELERTQKQIQAGMPATDSAGA